MAGRHNIPTHFVKRLDLSKHHSPKIHRNSEQMNPLYTAESVKIPDAIKKKIERGSKLDLELGCGNRKRHLEAIGIDSLAYDGVDIVGDIFSILKEFPDESIKAVYAYHCIELLNDLVAVMEQLCRILVKNGKLLIVVPHFSHSHYYSNAHYYSGQAHRQAFGLYTFSYLAKDELFLLRCPTYQRSLCCEIKKVKLVFKSPKPLYGRWDIKKVVQWFVNLNRYTMEFYEENLCWLIPCYKIIFELRRS